MQQFQNTSHHLDPMEIHRIKAYRSDREIGKNIAQAAFHFQHFNAGLDSIYHCTITSIFVHHCCFPAFRTYDSVIDDDEKRMATVVNNI